ncbi:MAG TPA: nuclear transport factor 2 family protein [Candidatus Aminicenantes bacterium]|nr:nuclear transport factor 2 family protein [Candidatus Aminicenantes bacterium]
MGIEDIRAVRAVMEDYVRGAYDADIGLLRSCFHPSAVMNGYLLGHAVLATPEVFFQDVAGKPAMSKTGAPFRCEITHIDVAGDIASVTLKESGFFGELRFTDFFHLVKVDGAWKIFSKAFTTE